MTARVTATWERQRAKAEARETWIIFTSPLPFFYPDPNSGWMRLYLNSRPLLSTHDVLSMPRKELTYDFYVSIDLGTEMVDLYKDVFETSEVLDEIGQIKANNDDHGVELKETKEGMGSGVFCGENDVNEGEQIFVYCGEIREETTKHHERDPTEQDYVMGIVGKTTKHTKGLEINGKGTAKKPYNAIWLNHSCRNANVKLIKKRVGPKNKKIYLIVGVTTKKVKKGEQFMLNYNGGEGEIGYFRPYSELLEEYPIVPADKKIIRCLCETPCPYDFARIVKRE
jgi:hypothetical protein